MLHDFEGNSTFSAEQRLKTRGRIAIFIDGTSLFYAAYNLGIEIDYIKLLSRLTEGARLLRCFFYTGFEPRNEKQQRFLLWLRRHGYRVVSKELAHLPDGSKKVNLDVEMVVDMMALVDFYDTAVLVSGSGSLTYAANAISYRGVRVELVSLRSMTSECLFNVCDRFIDLASLKEDIQKTTTFSPKSSLNSSLNLLASPSEQ